jgi:peptide/nickel transport system substrate-binding protein
VQTKPEPLSTVIIRASRNRTFSFIPLVIGLLFLAACQPAEAPTATGNTPPSPILTRTLEVAEEQNVKGTPQPTAETEGAAQGGTRPSSTPTRGPSPTPTASLPARPSGTRESNQLNPLLAESEAGRALVPLLFDSLTTHDPLSGQLVPRLAEEWLVAPDSRTITFTLRADAQWHDGTGGS